MKPCVCMKARGEYLCGCGVLSPSVYSLQADSLTKFGARLAACKPQGKLPIIAMSIAVITGTHETLPGLLCGLYEFELQSSYLCSMYYYSLAHLSRPDDKVIPYSALEPECFRCQNICTECIQYLFNFAIEPP